MEMRKNFFETKDSQPQKVQIETIYFGGGTPSVLETKQLLALIEKTYELFDVVPNPEITIEANPDDLTLSKLEEFEETPFNRLSIGIQSFNQADLDYLNRIHSSAQAKEVLDNCLAVGFKNLTVDLIFGIPTLTDIMWLENLDYVIERKVPHISIYGLTVEPKTPLELFIRKGKSKPVDEEQYARQFEIMVDHLENAGYEHYEISNFALPGMKSKHNSAYWSGKPYLGIGPSAHSFRGIERSWNSSNTSKFINSINSGQLPLESEILSFADSYNEYIMTSLRTSAGCNSEVIRNRWGSDQLERFVQKIEVFSSQGFIDIKSDNFVLSKKGKLLTDKISAELFIV
jgi:oxygen-independent coproporphyrinogen-3 oxidase